MGEPCDSHADARNAYVILVGKPGKEQIVTR